MGLELVPAGVLAQANAIGFNTVPPGGTTWSADVQDDPTQAGLGDEAVAITFGLSVFEAPASASNLPYLCGKQVLS